MLRRSPRTQPKFPPASFPLVVAPDLASFHPQQDYFLLSHIHEDRVFLRVFFYVIDKHVKIILIEE